MTNTQVQFSPPAHEITHFQHFLVREFSAFTSLVMVEDTYYFVPTSPQEAFNMGANWGIYQSQGYQWGGKPAHDVLPAVEAELTDLKSLLGRISKRLQTLDQETREGLFTESSWSQIDGFRPCSGMESHALKAWQAANRKLVEHDNQIRAVKLLRPAVTNLLTAIRNKQWPRLDSKVFNVQMVLDILNRKEAGENQSNG